MIVQREWGTYEVLAAGANWKLKRLLVDPISKSSLQKHFRRCEFWFYPKSKTFRLILKEDWHQLVNTLDTVLEIIELQVGEACIEEDIERKEE